MSVTTGPAAPKAATKEAQPVVEEKLRFKARYAMAIVFAIWVVGWALLHGKQTLAVGEADLNSFHLWLNQLRDSFDASRDSNPAFVVIGAISRGLNWLIGNLQEVFSKPAFPRPVPQIGWLGAISLALFVALAFAGVRSKIGRAHV